ncbi:MAG: S41 family peptidase [Synergistales bacterium]|nr:S41 family peptidase [Synergistales bacterium]
MWKKTRGVILGIVIGALLVGLTGGLRADDFSLEQVVPFDAKSLWLIKQTRAILETYHVDEDGTISEDVLVHGALKGMVSSLGDPYTRYVSPEQLKEEEIEMEGEYGGLGIYITERDGRTVIISPIEDTPADRAGLKPQDVIVKVGDEVITGWDQQKVVSTLRGKPGTEVTIWVRRDDREETGLLRFDIVREQIQIKTVRFEMLRDAIAYIRLVHFNQKTAGELRSALHEVESDDARGLILDVRNNPGGLLDSAVDVADTFLQGGLVVGMKGRVKKANDEIHATADRVTDLPMIVLINEGSASASEIVAGALKDNGRALVMGQKSFGKGSVQTLFPLPEGSGLYVTIAKYHTPSGRIIDEIGLSPDITVSGDFVRVHSEDRQLQEAIEEMELIVDDGAIPVSDDMTDPAEREAPVGAGDSR